MKTYLLKINPTPRLILRAKQRAKDCMSQTKDPKQCRVHFELVDKLTEEARALGLGLGQDLVDVQDGMDQ